MNLEVYVRSRRMTYKQLAKAIEEKTGRKYHPTYLNRVGRGGYHLSSSLAYHLMMTFPDFIALPVTQKRVSVGGGNEGS